MGRGGGSPVYRALSALPPGTIGDRIKITEQGEIISQKFALAPHRERSLEVMLTGTLLASREDWRAGLPEEDVDRWRDTMDRLAASALPMFRNLVHDHNELFHLFQGTTPVRSLAHVHFGSRPAYRDRGAGTMKGIRAIPWVFGWTQTRLMLPGWLGVGTALSEEMERPDGLRRLREMARAGRSSTIFWARWRWCWPKQTWRSPGYMSSGSVGTAHCSTCSRPSTSAP